MYRLMCVELDRCQKSRKRRTHKRIQIYTSALRDPSRFLLLHPNQHGTPVFTHIDPTVEARPQRGCWQNRHGENAEEEVGGADDV